MLDTRLAELRFLQYFLDASNEAGSAREFSYGADHFRNIEINPEFLMQMAASMLEDGCLRFTDQAGQRLVAYLRKEGELQSYHGIPDWYWNHPREGLENLLRTSKSLIITYAGLQRMTELRERLVGDVILDHFGVLIDFRHYIPELRRIMKRTSPQQVDIIAIDLDGFGKVNKDFGHAAGDALIIAARAKVKDLVGTSGYAYARGGDEMRVIILGQDEGNAVQLAQKIREELPAMKIAHNGVEMPSVTASIGVASTPPEKRMSELDELADERQRKAKKLGKNCVVSQ